MRSFIDSANRTWTISLTIDAVKRVRDSSLGVNLLELDVGDPPLFTRLGTNIILLCDVIYVLIKPQADAVGVTDEQFGASLGGEVIFAAQKAFNEELISFFQSLGRTDLAKALTAQRNLIDRAVIRVGAEMESLNVDLLVDETFGKLSTSLPGRAESTQAL